MLSLLACGAGIYIGRYFSVLALLPFSLLGAGAQMVSSWAAEHTPRRQYCNFGVSLISCQAGDGARGLRPSARALEHRSIQADIK
jgi:hypothetical protein